MPWLLKRGGQTTRLVIAGGHQDGLSVRALDKVEDGLEGAVVLDYFMHLRGRVVDVAGVVDATTLNHEEEAHVGVLGGELEGPQRRLGHLAQRGVDVVHVAAVELKGNVCPNKETHKGQVDLVAALKLVESGARVGIGP